ncbi:hypothetical protein KHU12_25715, partial [Pseudocitrobacter faecalis]
ERYEKDFAKLNFNNQPMMVGNWAQSILHGGVIASALDVAAGLFCVGRTLTRHATCNGYEPRQRPSRMGTIAFRAAYFIWGIAPAYFKLIYYVPADEILTHRVIWSFFFMVALISI